MSFKNKKVFDCQKMPKDIRKLFLAWVRADGPIPNRVYVDWHTSMWTGEAEGDEENPPCMDEKLIEDFHKVNNWLLANGMEKNEDVIISHWW